jgi:HAD superfamily hydrolase (TIGR01509 family)
VLGGVLFDLDETLIDAGGCHREASRRAFAAFGLDWDEALRRTGPFFGRRMREILAARRDALGIAESAAPLGELLVLRQRAYVEVFPAGVRLLPGAQEAVASVRQHGAMAAIVSSSERAIITLTMEHFGLAHLVSFVVGGDDVQNGKPDPECYELAYQRLQSFRPVVKRECLVVEDSAVGVTAARAAGLPVCLIPYSPASEPPKADYTLTSLGEFLRLVTRLSAG